MLQYLIKRLLLAIPICFGVATLAFFLLKLSPGDPAISFLGNQASPESIAALRSSWGLDRPLSEQYLRFLGGLLTGDLGQSQYYHAPIAGLIAQRLPVTLMLMLLATVFSVAISVPLAIWSATSNGGLAVFVNRLLSALLLGVPMFFVGAILLQVFGVQIPIFPPGGYGDTFVERLWSLVLPGLTVGLHIVPMLTRSLSRSVRQSTESEFYTFAEGKGLKPGQIMRQYVMRNAAIPAISVLSIQIANIGGGALVAEQVFGIPGMGDLLLSGVLNRDYPTVQVCAVVFGVLVVTVYLLTDLVYGLVDPRVKLNS